MSAQPAAGDMRRRPDLFIIGAPKSGTTSLYEYLEGHPDVYMSPVKEPFYFSPDVNSARHRRFVHGRDEDAYLALFADAGDQKRLGEASTRYMLSRAAPRLVREFQPSARVVALLRNPVDMIHARHNELVSLGEEDITDFEAALAADDDRRAGRRLPPGSNPWLAVYREQVRYADQLGRWIDELGRERLHVIIFDDFVADTAGEFRRLLTFLDVDPDYRPSSFAARNRSHRIRGGPLGLALRSRSAGWLAHEILPRLVGGNKASRLRRRLRHTRLYRRPNPREPIRPALRDALEKEFEQDVARISHLLDRDLGALWFGSRASG